MDRAGIPYIYRDNCKIRREADGTVNFYFGGLGGNDGLGHAHVSMDETGHVTYNRGVFDAHGANNFTDFEKRQQEYRTKHKRNWDSEVEQGVLETGEYVTFKTKNGGTDILIARGHVSDIQDDIDHLHAWNQNTGIPDHHDMRYTKHLFKDEDSE